jgi:hypothetical protein
MLITLLYSPHYILIGQTTKTLESYQRCKCYSSFFLVQRLRSYNSTNCDAHETHQHQDTNTSTHSSISWRKQKLIDIVCVGPGFVRSAYPQQSDGTATQRKAKQSKHNLQLETVKFHYHQKLLMAWIIRHCKSRMNTTPFGAKPKINAPFLFTVCVDFILLLTFKCKRGKKNTNHINV